VWFGTGVNCVRTTVPVAFPLRLRSLPNLRSPLLVTIMLAVIVPIMIVAEMMMRPVRVAMPMVVPVHMLVAVPVFMLMRMMMQPLARPRAARVLAEHQRLDGDRHGVGRHADAAEVDVVEVHQGDAVDDQDVARDIELLAQDGAERLRHVRRPA
jgi:hypothetical protein